MLFDLLTEKARTYPDKIAVVEERKSLTFSKLHHEASCFALYLKTLGFKKGDPILIGLPSSPDFYVAMYGAWALGLLALPVSPTAPIPPTYQAKNPRGAIGTADFLVEVKTQCPGVRTVIPWSSSDGLAIPDLPGVFKKSQVYLEQPILCVSSSGTTGEPKLYLRTSELIHTHAKIRVEVQQIKSSDIFLSTRSLHNAAAINNFVVPPIMAGAKVIIHERFERFKVADAIRQERVTVLYSVPFVFEILATLPQSRPVDFSSIRLCIAGGAPLPPSVANQFFHRFGIHIRQRYAGSHFYPTFSYNIDGPIDSVGRVNGFFPMAILDEDGHTLASGQIGEIAFTIAKLPPLLRRVAEGNPNRMNDYILTGDLGRVDDDGNVYVVGRRSPFIKVGGNRVEPAEVENALRSHPAVREAIVYPLHQGQTDEAIGAIVAAIDVSEQELLQHCADRLESYKCPRQIVLKDELPRTEQGKVSRRLFESLEWLILILNGANNYWDVWV